MRVADVELVATAWHVPRRTTFEQRDAAGTWVRKTAETYEIGTGIVDAKTIMLLQRAVLTRPLARP